MPGAEALGRPGLHGPAEGMGPRRNSRGLLRVSTRTSRGLEAEKQQPLLTDALPSTPPARPRPPSPRGHLATWRGDGVTGLTLSTSLWDCGPVLTVSKLPQLHEDNAHYWEEHKNATWGTSLVAQWLRICLPMQGTRVRALVWEDPTCCGATRPVRHSY